MSDRPKLSFLKSLQYRLEAILLSSVIFLFRLIPVDAASAMMGFLWRTIAPWTLRHGRALRHLEKAFPEKSLEEREKILRSMWENLGRVAAETFFIDRLLQQDERFEVVADEGAREILDKNLPSLFVSLHSGCWELTVQPAVAKDIEIAGVYQALKNPSAETILKNMRLSLYKGGLHSKSHQTARLLLATLRRGGTVAMMGDLRERRGVEVSFFGQSAFATPVPASLARSADVPIVLGRVIRKNGCNFRVEGRILTPVTTDDRKADIAATTQSIHDVFEEWIREHPEQWMWIHRKWD
ncbi:lauroyl acyltransferase [Roseibium sediminis]|uniref:LpxL/LpxP family acyltransferase n=1 Tax=Roseibium sediminis TaxID=1775174 RepID=UPI00123D2769|nr:lauroyl acyltransferase [Roseibium sediminis]